MRRIAAAVAGSIVVAVTLAGCGGASDYCKAVEKDQESLNTFGKTRTDAAYAKYATVFEGIAKVAPSTIKDDWTTLAEVTRTVLATQKDVGLALEDMADTEKVKKIDQDDLTKLNEAYTAFNKTTAQRTAVVKNVKQECKITLK